MRYIFIYGRKMFMSGCLVNVKMYENETKIRIGFNYFKCIEKLKIIKNVLSKTIIYMDIYFLILL